MSPWYTIIFIKITKKMSNPFFLIYEFFTKLTICIILEWLVYSFFIYSMFQNCGILSRLFILIIQNKFILVKRILRWKMKQSRKFKQYDVCAQHNHRSGFSAHLRTNKPSLNTGENVRCAICKLVPSFCLDYDNQLPTEEHLDRVVLAAPIRKIRCETCNKELGEYVYKDLSESKTLNVNLNFGGVQWKLGDICNVENGSSFWGKHV